MFTFLAVTVAAFCFLSLGRWDDWYGRLQRWMIDRLTRLPAGFDGDDE